MENKKEQLQKKLIETLKAKLQLEGFEVLSKKFDAVLSSLSKKWDSQIIKNINLPENLVIKGNEEHQAEVKSLLERLGTALEAKKLPDIFDVKMKKPDWYVAPKDAVAIKNEVVVKRNLIERKEDQSIMSAMAVSFMEALATFFTKLSKGTFKVVLGKEHFLTPQMVILVDRLGKPINMKDIGIGTFNQTVNQSSSGGSRAQVGIAGAGEITDGTVTVTTAGTRVQMPNQRSARVFIQAHPSNTGDVVIGGAGVIASSGTRRGLALFATQWQEFQVSNLNKLWIDSTADGDKVNYIVEYNE